MSIVVEHEKRRREILEKALDVFMEEGFVNVTFQKIADRCEITRTTLYTYFKNKGDMFNFSIKQFLSALENDITSIRADKGLSCQEKLIRVMTLIIERLEENRRLVSVILDYIIFLLQNEHDPGYRVRRRTVRLRHILATMLIEGIKAGELDPAVNVKDANELLFGLLEAAIFRLAALRRPSADEIKDAVKLAIQGFAAASAINA